MKSTLTLLSSFRLLVLAACFSLLQYNASGQCAWYIVNSNPWGQTFNITAMNNVYGVGNWQQQSYTAANPAVVFAPSSCMVFLEGSDGNAVAMNTFITANISAIETWVNQGGRLFFNSAPNQGGNMNWGFGGTMLQYPPSYYTTADAVSPTNPIFLGPYLPTATSYTGNYFAHAWIDGVGTTDLINGTIGYPVHPVCSEKLWGTGIAFFGSMTQPNWWQPQPQGPNLWYNIIYYIANIQLTSLTSTIPLNSYCGGETFTMSYSSSGLTFVGGNNFNVELSDATGSFATPTVIGTLTSAATTGTISCTIPANTPTGTGYRIRTVSDNPVFTGANNGTDITITTPVYTTMDISVSPGDGICTGTPATFTANYTGGGPTPNFQWYKNNLPVGGNSPTYTDNAINDGDVYYCVYTSSALCATPVNITSNYITMTVADPSTPTIIVYASPSDTICPGTTVDFATLITHGGPAPTYQWTKNGNPVGGNSPTYTDNTLADGDIVECSLTSSAACVTPVTTSSNQMNTKIVNSGFLAGNISYPVTKQIVMSNYTYTVSDAECNLMATIAPTGAAPIHDITNVSVSLSQSENTFNGQPYVKRHWDINPVMNEETSTATITIYAYQSEFDSYNVLATGWGFPLLPSNPTDAAGMANVRVTQFHGIGNVPQNYPGPEVVLTPTSVTWDTVYHWWAITFPVTGFSGFYIHTTNGPLSVSNAGNADFSVHAYPNPVENTLTVNVTGTRSNNAYLSLTDATGKLVQKVQVTDNTTHIDMSHVASGLYLIKYTDDARTETLKVTKQ